MVHIIQSINKVKKQFLIYYFADNLFIKLKKLWRFLLKSTQILPSVVYYKNVSSLNYFLIKLQIKQKISKNILNPQAHKHTIKQAHIHTQSQENTKSPHTAVQEMHKHTRKQARTSTDSKKISRTDYLISHGKAPLMGAGGELIYESPQLT